MLSAKFQCEFSGRISLLLLHNIIEGIYTTDNTRYSRKHFTVAANIFMLVPHVLRCDLLKWHLYHEVCEFFVEHTMAMSMQHTQRYENLLRE